MSETTSPFREFTTAYSPALDKKLFIKRSTTQAELERYTERTGRPLYDHSRVKEGLENEAAAIAFVRQHTTIPVPNVVATFEDRESFYLIEEFVLNTKGALWAPRRYYKHINNQLEGYMVQLRDIKSDTCRSFSGRPFFAARLGEHSKILVDAVYNEIPGGYVLSHGDLGWQNLLCDPDTWDIVCVIDWEYSGFYPSEVDGDFWKRERRTVDRKKGTDEMICSLIAHTSKVNTDAETGFWNSRQATTYDLME